MCQSRPASVVERAAHIVLGNHEEKHFRLLSRQRRGQDPLSSASDEHRRTRELVGPDRFDRLAARIVPFLRLETHGVLAVHAGLHEGVRPEDHEPAQLCRVQLTRPGARRSPWLDVRRDETGAPSIVPLDLAEAHAKGYRFFAEVLPPSEHVVVYGHTVVPAPLVTHVHDGEARHGFVSGLERVERQGLAAIGIDTGVLFGGSLTALLVPEWTTVSVPARRRYWAGRLEDE